MKIAQDTGNGGMALAYGPLFTAWVDYERTKNNGTNAKQNWKVPLHQADYFIECWSLFLPNPSRRTRDIGKVEHYQIALFPSSTFAWNSAER